MQDAAKIVAGCGIAMLLALSLAVPAAADNRDVQLDSPPPSRPESTRVNLELTHPLSLLDAVSVARSLDEPVQSFAFATDNVVGEFSPATGLSIEDYLTFFQENYGTQPEVRGLVVLRPTDEQESLKQGPTQVTNLGSDFPQFDAPPVALGAGIAERTAETASELEGRASTASPRSAGDWRPDNTNHGIGNSGGIAFFGQQFSWTNYGLNALPLGIGMEFEVNEDNGSVAAPNNLRPLCFDSSQKDRFWASNYGYSWTVTDIMGSASPSGLGAYADYNDYEDPCRNNSIAVGLRYPKMLTTAGGTYPIATLDLVIMAPRGLESSSLISGNVQTVTNTFCDRFPGNTWALTDCMGIDDIAAAWSGYPAGNYNRGTLNISRGWYVPSHCWNTYDHGDTFADGGCTS